MKKIFPEILILTSVMLASCNESANKGNNAERANQKDTAVSVHTEPAVPFTEAKGYFVRNDFKNDSLQVLTLATQKEFDTVFGAATTMSKERPTIIDFSKQYVIALIAKETDKATAISAKKLQHAGNVINLSYEFTLSEKQSFTMRPALILLVDSQYKGEIKLVK
jgi:hypothetical protein